jgi:hypothetical protein
LSELAWPDDDAEMAERKESHSVFRAIQNVRVSLPGISVLARTHEPVGTPNLTGVIRPLAISLTPRNSTVSLPVVVPLDGAFLDTP